MTTDIFRVDYYPHRAHAKFSQLKGDEIAMLMQIINLIYMNSGPIQNDGKYLSQSIYDFGTAKCNRLVKILLEKGHIYDAGDNKIGQVMAEKQLGFVRVRSETRAKAGSIGGKTKAENEQKQQHSSSNSISTSTSTSILPPIVPQGGRKSKRKSYQQKKEEAINGALNELGITDEEIAEFNATGKIGEDENCDTGADDQSEL